MSLIDSSVVGLSSAVLLAALGPGTTVIDGSSYLFVFINIATTNLLANAAANDDEKESSLVVLTSLRAATRCGTGVMLLLLAVAPQILRVYVGAGSSAVVNPASRYVWIRALSLPTTLAANALQAALLGAKDSVTPLVALGSAAVLNLALDLLFVCGFGWGISGAAAATVFSQWCGLALLAKSASGKLLKQPASKDLERRRAMNTKFYSFAPAVLIAVVGKMCAFGFMTHVASTLSAASLAAHQVALSSFFLLATFSEISSQTFQAFLPSFESSSAASSQSSPRNSQRLVIRLQSFALSVGIVVAAIGGMLPLFGAGLFTRDAAVAAALRPLALPLFAAAALHAAVCSAEGVLLVRRELEFLGKVYAASAILMPAALMAIKRKNAGLGAIWGAFVVFQAARAAILNWRVHMPHQGAT